MSMCISESSITGSVPFPCSLTFFTEPQKLTVVKLSFYKQRSKNSILHLTVTVGTWKRYRLVRKSLVINLLNQFQYNLEGSKLIVLTATENASERMLKVKIEKRAALSFNLYKT